MQKLEENSTFWSNKVLETRTIYVDAKLATKINQRKLIESKRNERVAYEKWVEARVELKKSRLKLSYYPNRARLFAKKNIGKVFNNLVNFGN